MAKHLRLTGANSVSHPRLYQVSPILQQVVRVSDADATILLALTTKNEAGTTVPLFTDVGTGVAANFDVSNKLVTPPNVAGIGYDPTTKRVKIPGSEDVPIPVWDGASNEFILPGTTPRRSSVTIVTTWEAKPLPADYIGTAFITNVGIGGSMWRSTGSAWVPMESIILAHGGAREGSITTGTTEQVLKNFLIKGGVLGLNRGLRLTTQVQYSGNTNTKTITVRMGATSTGLAGTALRTSIRNSNGVAVDNMIETIRNRGAANSQIYGANMGLNSQAIGILVTTAVDTSVDFNLSMTGTTGTSGDVIYLESYLLELV